MRGLQIARATMDREGEVSFDARGLLRQEARLQADIRVAALPDGFDPDDVVNRNPADWVKLIENAKPIVVHVMETLAAGRNLDDAKAKAEIAAQVLPLIEDVPNAIEREDYRQRLARLLRVDERALEQGQTGRARPVARPGARPPREGQFPQRGPADVRPGKARGRDVSPLTSPLTTLRSLEAYCLGILLRRPDLIYKVDRALQKAGLTRLSAFDFQDASYQDLVKVILSALSQDFSEPLHVILGSVPLALMEVVDDLLLRTEKLDPNDTRVLEELLRVILKIRWSNAKQNGDHMRYLMEEAQNQGDTKATDYLHGVQQYTVILKSIDHALRKCNDRTLFVG
jgi:DNA primase